MPEFPRRDSPPPRPAIPPSQRETVACLECGSETWEWVPVTSVFRDRLDPSRLQMTAPPNGEWSIRCVRCLHPLPKNDGGEMFPGRG